MQQAGVSSRKSKRVAKRQEDEIYWLIHNFPQGMDYSDLCNSSGSRSNLISKSGEQHGLPMPIRKVLRGNNAKVAAKLPRMLRSGKSIPQNELHSSSSSEVSANADIGELHEALLADSISPTEIKESDNFIEKNDLSNTITLNQDAEDESKQVIEKNESEEKRILSLEEKELEEQEERVERLKLPKFQSEPTKICTRSGAYYEFSWKSQKKQQEKQSSESQTKTSPNIVTRSSLKGKWHPCNQAKTVEKSTKALSPKLEMQSKNSPSAAKKIRSEKSIKSDINKRLPSQPDKACKRKRLSLLPQQKQPEEEVASWLEALNRNDTPTSDKNTPCSRSESPESPLSSTCSDVPSSTRAGRTASMNCKAVISALIKSEPSMSRKSLNDSQPEVSGNHEDKCLIDLNQPKSYFKVKVSSNLKQQVEVFNNGISTKVPCSVDSLKKHELAVISNVEKIRVTTNGWSWLGKYIWYHSFYRNADKKVTRLYFGAMARDGVELRVGDSVALQTSEKDNIKPFVGKIIAMWQDNLGEMMVTLCWFYRPSDLENIKSPYGCHELYLSKHTDDNSVATIQDKVHVLSFPEYCRYYASLAEQKYKSPSDNLVPNTVKWKGPKKLTNSSHNNCIYFCRGVYDFRLKRTLKQQLYYTKYL